MKKRREDRIKEQMERELERQREQRQADEIYMKEAIKQAKKAYAIQEVPIGCVIVHEGKIIGRGYNRRTTDKNPLAHAEIAAIRKASKKMDDWRLEECTLYVTLEPCQMCAGAIVQARITAGCGGVYESKGRVCRLYFKSACRCRNSIIRLS